MPAAKDKFSEINKSSFNHLVPIRFSLMKAKEACMIKQDPLKIYPILASKIKIFLISLGVDLEEVEEEDTIISTLKISNRFSMIFLEEARVVVKEVVEKTHMEAKTILKKLLLNAIYNLVKL